MLENITIGVDFSTDIVYNFNCTWSNTQEAEGAGLESS